MVTDEARSSLHVGRAALSPSPPRARVVFRRSRRHLAGAPAPPGAARLDPCRHRRWGRVAEPLEPPPRRPRPQDRRLLVADRSALGAGGLLAVCAHAVSHEQPPRRSPCARDRFLRRLQRARRSRVHARFRLSLSPRAPPRRRPSARGGGSGRLRVRAASFRARAGTPQPSRNGLDPAFPRGALRREPVGGRETLGRRRARGGRARGARVHRLVPRASRRARGSLLRGPRDRARWTRPAGRPRGRFQPGRRSRNGTTRTSPRAPVTSASSRFSRSS